jgi:hypothetical protein
MRGAGALLERSADGGGIQPRTAGQAEKCEGVVHGNFGFWILDFRLALQFGAEARAEGPGIFPSLPGRNRGIFRLR